MFSHKEGKDDLLENNYDYWFFSQRVPLENNYDYFKHKIHYT